MTHVPLRGDEPSGVFSARLLADLQARAWEGNATTAVLVEGLSDYYALHAAAALASRDLKDEQTVVVPMGGATNLRHYIDHFRLSGRIKRLVGLCDLAEEPFFVQTVERSSGPAVDFFVCDRDLEDELIRAVGAQGVEAIIEREGELESFRRLQQMPPHRGRSVDEQLHRFMGVRSGRKYRYAPLLAAALTEETLPRPIRDLLNSLASE